MKRIRLYLIVVFLTWNFSISISQQIIDEKVDYSSDGINLDFYGIADYTFRGMAEPRKGFLVAGWEYGLSKIYFINNQLSSQNNPLELFSSQDRMVNVVSTIPVQDGTNEILLAGGFYSKCLCGVLLKKTDNQTQFTEIIFDDTDNPFVSNIFCITDNIVDNNNSNELRIFLGCSEGKIFFSEDFGETFKLSNVDSDNLVFKVIKFVDNRKGYALAGENQNKLNMLFKTEDYGNSWTLVYDFTSMNVLFNDLYCKSESSVWLFGSSGSDGVVYSITDNQQIVVLQYFPKPLIGGIANALKAYYRAVDINGRLYVLDEFGKLKNSTSEYSDSDRMNFTFANEKENSMLVCGNDGRILKYLNLNTNIDDLVAQNPAIFFDNSSKSLKLLNLHLLNSSHYSLQIFNIMGKNEYSNYNMLITRSELNLSVLQPGIYFYRIFTSSTQFCGKFIIL